MKLSASLEELLPNKETATNRVSQKFNETFDDLEPIAEMKTGLLVYNKPHSKQEIVYSTNNSEEILDLVQSGWRLFPGAKKWVLKAPEATVCDLSEIDKNPSKEPNEILAFYRTLTEANFTKLITGFKHSYAIEDEIVPISGTSLETEKRIASSNKKAFTIYRKNFFNFVKDTSMFQKESETLEGTLKKREYKIRFKPLKDCCSLSNLFIKDVKELYTSFRKDIMETIGQDRIPYGIWKQLDFDVIIFVPVAGLKYAAGYIEDIKDDKKIMLWEYHTGTDLNKELISFRKNLKGKKVAVVDRAYTGNTINYLKKEVEKLGGNCTPIVLFPKSKTAIECSDQVLFVDTFVSKKKLHINSNWAENLFIDVINANL